ncbi:MAG TPA: single-stranded DNA-binding protein [Firmicutes bacterium]|nr:MAG: single-stranded DNA-binding protein [Peptococcaceae bacterium 1109]HHT74074.1 single-stranded DNA-binding protein [Bacillota bacterium]
MLNRIILIGRLVADPQLRYTQTGIAVANFTIAVDRPFLTQAGERETDFIDIVSWRKQAETVANHLSKGRLVAVEGRLQVRSYDDQNGIRRKAAEVVADQVRFLDRARDGGSVVDDDISAGPPEPEFDDVPF